MSSSGLHFDLKPCKYWMNRRPYLEVLCRVRLRRRCSRISIKMRKVLRINCLKLSPATIKATPEARNQSGPPQMAMVAIIRFPASANYVRCMLAKNVQEGVIAEILLKSEGAGQVYLTRCICEVADVLRGAPPCIITNHHPFRCGHGVCFCELQPAPNTFSCPDPRLGA
jgi:hypothetical protein